MAPPKSDPVCIPNDDDMVSVPNQTEEEGIPLITYYATKTTKCRSFSSFLFFFHFLFSMKKLGFLQILVFLAHRNVWPL